MKVLIPAAGLMTLGATASAFVERRFITEDKLNSACENKDHNGTSVSRLCYEGLLLTEECFFGSECSTLARQRRKSSRNVFATPDSGIFKKRQWFERYPKKSGTNC